MQQELNAPEGPSSSLEPSSRDTTPRKLASIDITQISAIRFHFNMLLPDNKVFLTIMYKINLLLEEKEALAAKDQETVDLIHMKLPTAY